MRGKPAKKTKSVAGSGEKLHLKGQKQQLLLKGKTTNIGLKTTMTTTSQHHSSRLELLLVGCGCVDVLGTPSYPPFGTGGTGAAREGMPGRLEVIYTSRNSFSFVYRSGPKLMVVVMVVVQDLIYGPTKEHLQVHHTAMYTALRSPMRHFHWVYNPLWNP